MNFFSENISFLLETRPSERNQWKHFSGENTDNPPLETALALSNHFSIPLDYLVRVDLRQKSEARSKNIRLLVMDIDGVMTDGGMYYSESGDEFKKFNAKDGMAIRYLSSKGIKSGIISHGVNTQLVKRRAERLQVDLVEISQIPKLETLQRWCLDLGISLESVAYIGDDINDLEVLGKVGFAACPADAVSQVKEIVHIILSKKGGEGCIREMVDQYLG